MEIKIGYIYHIKDSFFDLVNDDSLMQNHERGKKRPTYLTIKDNDILWFIPLSSKIEKYKKIIDKKTAKYGKCQSILIREIAGNDSVILLQNAFPTLEKYIDYAHTINGNHIRVINELETEIPSNFRYMLSLKRKGTNLFFTDIDKIIKIISNNKD